MQIKGFSVDKKWLIQGVIGLIVLALLLAVLVFQIIEFCYYRQQPSVWPVATQGK
jgi:hypothetical protein